MTVLTSEQIEAFERDGAVLARGLLDAGSLALLRAAFDELKASAYDLSDYYSDGGPKREGTSLVRDDNWMHSDAMRRVVLQSAIPAAAAAAMRSSTARIYEDLLIYKSPGADQPTPWHQDEPQWPLTGRQMSSAWLCLEPVTRATGALRFVAGTHRGPMHIPYVPAAQRAALEADMHHFTGGPIPAIDADPERYRVLSFDCEPGDVVLFHPRAIHGAFGAERETARRTFSIRYIGDDVRWQGKASVFHGWLNEISLKDGDKVEAERFPLAWEAMA